MPQNKAALKTPPEQYKKKFQDPVNQVRKGEHNEHTVSHTNLSNVLLKISPQYFLE